MALKAILDADGFGELPEAIQEYYKQDGDNYVLDVEGVEEHPAAKSLKTALDGERTKRSKATKRAEELENKMKVLGDRDPEQLQEILDEYEDLKAKQEAGELPKGEDMDKQIEERVKSRLDREIRPFKRDLEKVQQERDELNQKLSQVNERNKQLTIDTAIERAADKVGAHKTAKRDIRRAAREVFDLDDDGNIVGKDDLGYADADLTPEKWLEAQREEAPHWFPSSSGGGAAGGESPSNGGPKSIDLNQPNAIGQHLEAFARGEVQGRT